MSAMTGYTAPIVHGEDVSLSEFIKGCAAGMWYGQFGLRSDVVPNDHHKVELEKAVNMLEVWTGMDDETRDQRYAQERDEHTERIRDYVNSCEVVVSALKEMYVKVDAWEPPSSDHEPLKKFAKEQLMATIRGNEPVEIAWPYKSAAEWLEHKVTKTLADIDYHRTRYQDERTKVAGVNEWVARLLESLE